MGILRFLSGQFIDVIHLDRDNRDTMVFALKREGHEDNTGPS